MTRGEHVTRSQAAALDPENFEAGVREDGSSTLERPQARDARARQDHACRGARAALAYVRNSRRPTAARHNPRRPRPRAGVAATRAPTSRARPPTTRRAAAPAGVRACMRAYEHGCPCHSAWGRPLRVSRPARARAHAATPCPQVAAGGAPEAARMVLPPHGGGPAIEEGTVANLAADELEARASAIAGARWGGQAWGSAERLGAWRRGCLRAPPIRTLAASCDTRLRARRRAARGAPRPPLKRRCRWPPRVVAVGEAGRLRGGG